MSELKPIRPADAWMIERFDGTKEVVLSPITDDTFIDYGDKYYPLYATTPDPAWIPVCERLPETDLPVLLWIRLLSYGEECHAIGNLRKSGGWNTTWTEPHEIIAWQDLLPLPDAPKDAG